MAKGPKPIEPSIRFDAKWRLDEATGCHVWTATLSSAGYGCFFVRDAGRQVLAHRFSYERSKGAIPAGLHIDHLCRNKKCVNPDHLEAVTRQENHRRAPWTPKTHCNRGHALTAENVYVRPSNGMRRCRECAKVGARVNAKARYEPRIKVDPDALPPNAGLLALAFC